ncbi:hypothetical protein CCHOA_06020 [Corynebacterium choanae]|uniref:Uncharacterized protein n=1 Tax=Corynebacterium choanae TaxID=1862358 RepID=A0A3G6J756_9CORY|nr:hypothetical protein CCHOA_06020 [Corynebacterium choanae]
MFGSATILCNSNPFCGSLATLGLSFARVALDQRCCNLSHTTITEM